MMFSIFFSETLITITFFYNIDIVHIFRNSFILDKTKFIEKLELVLKINQTRTLIIA